MTSVSRGPRARAAGILVWLVWAAALGGILLAIARHGRNVPFEEDWLMVGAMTGHQADLPDWLWAQNSEHRLPLPRLVNLAVLRATAVSLPWHPLSDPNTELDLWWLLLGLVVLGFAQIVEHGRTLRAELDEVI